MGLSRYSLIRYVPNLKKNLISLGTLDFLGYGYSTKNGVMKITKDAMVIMKGKKIGNLYSYSGTQLSMELQCPPRQNQIMIMQFSGIYSLFI